jgi:hypothetical protein
MKATVQLRYPEAGFVVVRNTRMVFAPAKGNRQGQPQDEDAMMLSESNWGKPSPREVEACKLALQERFPDRKVLVTD